MTIAQRPSTFEDEQVQGKKEAGNQFNTCTGVQELVLLAWLPKNVAIKISRLFPDAA